MSTICFYFQVHQPRRVKRYRVFDIGEPTDYFTHNEDGNLNNKWILRKVSEKCYLPTNKLLLKLIKENPEFKISFSLSGVFLEQIEEWEPEVLKSFQDLVATGNVELLGETYYHSLAFLYSKEEFVAQVNLHKKKIRDLFNVETQVFRNTELIYNNDIAKMAEKLGFKGVIAEGADHILQEKSPNFVYSPPNAKNIKLLLKNYKLSDDIAFRFGSKDWVGYPLTTETFTTWIEAHQGNSHSINLFMDYETFGEHQWEDTGIFSFLEALPKTVLKNKQNNFMTPSGVIDSYESLSEINIPDFVSWADIERDLSAWRSNDMQHEALKGIYKIENAVLTSNDSKLLNDWRLMQTSDHFYYMCTKWFADGDVHKYFNPYDTPYDAFLSYMNVLKDMNIRLEDIHKMRTRPVQVKKLDSKI